MRLLCDCCSGDIKTTLCRSFKNYSLDLLHIFGKSVHIRFLPEQNIMGIRTSEDDEFSFNIASHWKRLYWPVLVINPNEIVGYTFSVAVRMESMVPIQYKRYFMPKIAFFDFKGKSLSLTYLLECICTGTSKR